jgi:hypothetical protein
MTNIQKQMMATFLSLRVGVGVIGIVFPLILWGGGNIAGVVDSALPIERGLAYISCDLRCLNSAMNISVALG